MSFKSKFVETYDEVLKRPIFIITDPQWWVAHEKELALWLQENTKQGLNTREGMTLNFMNDEEALWFKLKWWNQ